jgi:hypothetical protein
LHVLSLIVRSLGDTRRPTIATATLPFNKMSVMGVLRMYSTNVHKPKYIKKKDRNETEEKKDKRESFSDGAPERVGLRLFLGERI